jgi:hypothetical protein
MKRRDIARMSRFVGTFPLDAAMAVVLEGDDCSDSLQELMNELASKSLLSASVEDGAVVYRLLETTRVYALQRLAESGELERTSLRHAELFTDRVERAADLGKVRAALKCGFSSPSGHAVGVRLAAVAARMLLELGLVSECRMWCRLALDVIAAPDSGTLVEVGLLEAFGVSAMFSQGNREDVRHALTRGVELAHALGGGDDEVRLLGYLNSFLIRRGDFQQALEVAERSSAPACVAKRAGQLRATWMLAFSHHLCGNQPVAEGHCEAPLGQAAPGESSTVSDRSPGVFSPSHLGVLARTLWLRGQPLRTRQAMLARNAKRPYHRVEWRALGEDGATAGGLRPVADCHPDAGSRTKRLIRERIHRRSRRGLGRNGVAR